MNMTERERLKKEMGSILQCLGDHFDITKGPISQDAAFVGRSLYAVALAIRDQYERTPAELEKERQVREKQTKEYQAFQAEVRDFMRAATSEMGKMEK